MADSATGLGNVLRELASSGQAHQEAELASELFWGDFVQHEDELCVLNMRAGGSCEQHGSD